MELKKLNLLLVSLYVYGILNCSIGTRRDACKSDLKRDYSASFCDALSLAPFARSNDESTPNGINDLILGCLLYYESLQECNREENRYIPALYSRE